MVHQKVRSLLAGAGIATKNNTAGSSQGPSGNLAGIARLTDGASISLSGLQLSGNAPQQTLASIERATSQIDQLRSATQSHADLLNANTQAITQNTSSRSGGATGVVSSIDKVTGGLLSGALGAFPLVSGIMKLFGGNGQPAPPPLVKYQPTQKQDFSLGISNGDTGDVSYSSAGTPRIASVSELAFSGLAKRESASTPSSGAPSNIAPTHVTVQVQAMDSRSFLDRSDDIAMAVRNAMLNSHPLNDVISDL